MIHFFPMAQLVYHNTVNDLRWCKHQQAVKIQVSPAAAAAPAGALAADRDPAV